MCLLCVSSFHEKSAFLTELPISKMAPSLGPAVSGHKPWSHPWLFSLTHYIHSISNPVLNPLISHSTIISLVKAPSFFAYTRAAVSQVSLISLFLLTQQSISHTEPRPTFLKHKPDNITPCSQHSAVGWFFQLHMEHSPGHIIR